MNSHPTLGLADLGRGKGGHSPADFGTVSRWTYNGRGAIFQVLASLPRDGRSEVLVPAFHCPTLVEPVMAAGYTPVYFSVGRDLRLDLSDIGEKCRGNVRALVVVNYFGFPCDFNGLREQCHEAGIVLLEDCAHSFFSIDPVELCGRRGDVGILSFKKLVPTLVGGGVAINDQKLSSLEFNATAVPFRTAALDCKRLLEQLLDGFGEGNVLRSAYFTIERLRVRSKRKSLPEGESSTTERRREFEYPFDEDLAGSGMPWYARAVLNRADLGKVGKIRRINYSTLLASISNAGLSGLVWEDLPARICPWALPMIIQDRFGTDYRLRDSGIPVFTFGETLHKHFTATVDRNSKMSKDARWLADHLLCFPVHQGIDSAQLAGWGEKIANVFGDVARERTAV